MPARPGAAQLRHREGQGGDPGADPTGHAPAQHSRGGLSQSPGALSAQDQSGGSVAAATERGHTEKNTIVLFISNIELQELFNTGYSVVFCIHFIFFVHQFVLLA